MPGTRLRRCRNRDTIAFTIHQPDTHMENIISRIGVQAAYRMAQELYPAKDRAYLVGRVAHELCTTPEAVEEALRPVELSE